MRVVGLMLASNNEENGRSYMDMVTACKETWIANRHPNVEVIATWGKTYQPYITEKVKEGEWILTQENDLLINTEEQRENLLIKTIKGMECALLKYPDLDYIFRPNCGSYVKTDLLYEFLQDKPREKYFGGILGKHKGIPFISGACMLLSRDVVELIVKNQDKINLDGWKMMDDVSLAQYLYSVGIEGTGDGHRVMASSEQELEDSWDRHCYHYYFCHTINPELVRKTHLLFRGSAK